MERRGDDEGKKSLGRTGREVEEKLVEIADVI